MREFDVFALTLLQRSLGIVLAAFSLAALGQTGGSPSGALTDLSLDELLQIQVISLGRRQQAVNDVAGAAFVVTGEEIARSGATNLADALRLVPGLEVSRSANSLWSVASRGFPGRYSNKLLVLIDGRSVYSPLVSGVTWETLEVPLEDIDRIEVMRGPGAALWGANAMNGVVNVVTRHSRSTQGTLVSGTVGTNERLGTYLRHGGRTDSGTFYRFYASGFDRDQFPRADGVDRGNHWTSGSSGFRLDRGLDGGSTLSASGAVAQGRSALEYDNFYTQPPYKRTLDATQEISTAHLRVRYERPLSDRSELSLQGFVHHSHTVFDQLNGERRDIFDVDLQHRYRTLGMHDFVWGLNFRSGHDQIDSPGAYAVMPASRTVNLAGLFVQDEITLVPDKLRLTLGSRFDHNSITGFAMQPNARLMWKLTETHRVWLAASRAVRTPSRFDRDGSAPLTTLAPGAPGNPGPLPIYVLLQANPDYGNEKVNSYEAGWRWQLSPRALVDLSIFDNHYQNLRSFYLGTASAVIIPPVLFPQYVLQPAISDNGLSARMRGFELSTDWRVNTVLRVQPSLSRLIAAAPEASNLAAARQREIYVDGSPHYMFGLRVSLDVSPRHVYDLWLRHVAKLNREDVPAYTTLDLRYAYRPNKHWSFALIGQNLLDDRHQEWRLDSPGAPIFEVPRGVYARGTYRF